uniref:SFTPA2 n=1 Tax=Chrysolophus pictus TaxID=9089 RepID=A0A8C3LA80_CHRPC
MPSPELFHKILGLTLLLLPYYAQGKPEQFFPMPGFRAEKGISQAYLPGFPSVAGNEMEDTVLQLKDRISKLEGVLHLQGKITTSGEKIFATNGKTADFHAAVKMCQEAGGCIASPRNADENAAILHFVKQYNSFPVSVLTHQLTRPQSSALHDSCCETTSATSTRKSEHRHHLTQ